MVSEECEMTSSVEPMRMVLSEESRVRELGGQGAKKSCRTAIEHELCIKEKYSLSALLAYHGGNK